MNSCEFSGFIDGATLAKLRNKSDRTKPGKVDTGVKELVFLATGLDIPVYKFPEDLGWGISCDDLAGAIEANLEKTAGDADWGCFELIRDGDIFFLTEKEPPVRGICPDCGSLAKRNGFTHTMDRSIQRYRCHCGRHFSQTTALEAV